MKPKIFIDIKGKTPHGDLLLQSAPDIGHLQKRLSAYFEREFRNPSVFSNTSMFQRVINKKACDIPELSIYSFDPDQRVSELAVTLIIAATLNGINRLKTIPGWQRAGQKQIMEQFTGKKSWDGLLYEKPANDKQPVNPMFIEIKSTMVDPTEESLTPNKLLESRLEKYKEFFQSPGSLCAVFIMPYTPAGQQLSFDLKSATEQLNEIVSEEALGCVCLLSFPSKANGEVEVTLHCYIVNKNPILAEDGNIQHINLGKMVLGTIK